MPIQRAKKAKPFLVAHGQIQDMKLVDGPAVSWTAGFEEDTNEDIGLTRFVVRTPWQYGSKFDSNMVGCMKFHV